SCAAGFCPASSGTTPKEESPVRPQGAPRADRSSHLLLVLFEVRLLHFAEGGDDVVDLLGPHIFVQRQVKEGVEGVAQVGAGELSLGISLVFGGRPRQAGRAEDAAIDEPVMAS